MFIADLPAEDILVGKMLFSRHPRARITAIDAGAARQLEGVRAVITAGDIPGSNQIGVILPDQPLLAAEESLWIGDCLALVAAESESAADRALELIRVEDRPLPVIDDPEKAMHDSEAPLHPRGNVHTHLKIRKGNVEEGFDAADIDFQETFRTQRQEHAYLETLGVAALPQGDGSLIVRGAMQCPFYVQKGVAGVLGWPLNRVRVVQTTTGGGFGGKEDVPSEIGAFAALLAVETGRPVRMILSREEDLRRSSKRHPMTITYRMGASKDGRILAARVRVVADTGAYATISPVVLFRSTVHAAGPYEIPNVSVDTYGVYTNSVPNGAFRGFGTPQVTFAHESMIDQLADRAGKDPIEIRLLNGLRPGSATATGQVLKESVGLEKTLLSARRESGWKKLRGQPREDSPLRRGVGVAAMFYGVSLGARGWSLDAAAASAQVHRDGSVSVAIGGTEMGQGAQTVIAQMAADRLGLSLERITMLPVDTSRVPDSGPTVASRTTVFSGNAVLDALEKIAANMSRAAAGMLGCRPEEISFSAGKVSGQGGSVSFEEVAEQCYLGNVHLAAEGWYVSPPCSFDERTGQGDAYYVYGYGAQVAEVEVDMETGRVRVLGITAAHDVGKAINPQGVRGQIEGGVVQGVGYALMEDFTLAGGQIMTPDLATYIIPTSVDVPRIRSIIVEAASPDGPYGAKGLGEQPIIPTAAAIANAVAHATGIRMRNLPIGPEALRRAITGEEKEK
jgi:CO/xanthine dehydrogenase Mo-binding subunit